MTDRPSLRSLTANGARSMPRAAAGSPASTVTLGLLVVVISLLAGDWIAGARLVVLWSGWRLLRGPEGPPVLALAFTFQWVQVTIGLYYYGLTGRPLKAIDLSDYRLM